MEENKRQETKEKKGRLFRSKKRTKENSPHHSGICKIVGIEYWISAWVSESQDTKEKYFSLSFSEVQRDQPASNPEEINEDIPF